MTSPSRRAFTLSLLLTLAAPMNSISDAQRPAEAKDAQIPVHFTDIRKAAGITFVQDSTQTDEKYYLETMGTGVAWFDYDQDGLMDLYFVQSAATNPSNPPTRCDRLFIGTTATGHSLT